VPGDDAVAGHELIAHPEVAAAVRDELVDLFERARVEEQIDALTRGQLAALALPALPFFAAAGFGATLERVEIRSRIVGHTLAACAFSQSFRNRSSPMSVSGCLKADSMTAGGQVTTSAPRRAASTM
jgi:hypothetical protein